MSRRKRELSREERALWDSVARQADPIKREPLAPPVLEGARPATVKPPKPAPPPGPQTALRLGQAAKPSKESHRFAPDLTDHFASLPTTMDRKAFGRLRRGKLKPEARIDLHGMTLDQAHQALNGFVLRAAAQQKRLLLVITGKGKDRDEGGPIPQRLGVLRHQVPQWLTLPPLGPLVLQVSPASQRHGGQGAYYVYLRRHR